MILTLSRSPCGGMATNITIARGESLNLSGTIDIDMTGWSIKATVGFPTPLALTSTVTGASSSGSTYRITSPTSTETYPLGGYPYDIYAISPDGTALQMYFGELITKTSVTPIP